MMEVQNKVPTISVIIPAYNAERFVRATIKSVLLQTYPVKEIIVVDDGSTDSTPEILSSFGKHIRVIRQDNKGLASARNAGIAAASGDWLAFLDADDLWLPDFCKLMLEDVNSATNAGVIACGWRYVDIEGHQVGVSVRPNSSQVTFRQLLMGNAFPSLAAIVSQTWAERVDGFSSELNGFEDWDFWLRLAHAGCRFHVNPRILVSYRQVPGSMSRQVQLMRDNGKKILDHYFQRDDLPESVSLLRNTAYGLLNLWAGASFYEQKLFDRGRHEFVRTLTETHELLANQITYHVIITAQQPRQYKGTAIKLDLQSATVRVQAILSDVVHSDTPPDLQLQRLANSFAYQILAEYAFRQGRRLLTLHYAKLSLHYVANLESVRRVIRLVAKALVQPTPIVEWAA